MPACEKYIEFISSMTDGELTWDERQKLLEHIKTCKDCAKLYAAFQAISEENATLYEAPATLKDSVMYRVNFVKRDAKKSRDGKRPFRSYLTIAAVMAVVVFAAMKLTSPGEQLKNTTDAGISAAGAPEAYMSDESKTIGSSSMTVTEDAVPPSSAAPVPDVRGEAGYDTLLDTSKFSGVLVLHGSVPDELSGCERLSLDSEKIELSVPNGLIEPIKDDGEYTESNAEAENALVIVYNK